MNFNVVLTETAKRDVRAIIGWILEFSKSGSERWIRRWSSVLDSLANSPDSCGLAPEDQDHDEGIRQIIFKTRSGKPYRALFVIRDKQVIVLHVRGPGQDLIGAEDFELPE